MKDKKQSICVGCFFVDVKLSLASGMNGHLSKPVNIQKLEEILGALIS